MSIRSKLLVVIFAFGIAPMLLVSIFNYLTSVRTVERMLREELELNAERTSRAVEDALRETEAELAALARLRSLRAYVRSGPAGGAPDAPRQNSDVASVGPDVPPDVRAEVGVFYAGRQDRYASIACLDAERRPLFYVGGLEGSPDGELTRARFQTGDSIPDGVRADARVWTAPQTAGALRSPATREDVWAVTRLTIPVFLEEGDGAPRGALVVAVKLDSVFKKAAAGYDAPAARSREIIALDQSGFIVYHTSGANKYQPAETAMPFFRRVAGRMMRGESGVGFYEDRASEGDRWLAAYRPVKDLNLSVAVAGNYSEAVGGLERAGMSGVALLLLAALAVTVLLVVLVGRTARRIERVAAGAAAVAGGDLNQRIEVHTKDETRVLADSFNRMTDRLRELITREAETRQFQSFMRLSAMLTHDLKNAIAGLSMLVSNMERQFHREEFRADAILSLRDATDKLKRIVARLSEPVKSLSGEYRRDAQQVDLVPLIRRVVAATAEPSRPLYEIDLRLPDSLVAYAEPTRIENVVENLVINALEAMGARGGRLTVEAGEEPNDMVGFSVSDTGVGMSEDFLKLQLFRAFSTTKSRGIGLGLYTCREIVEAHGGRLDVESKPGVGTRFRVVLPSKPFTLRERLRQSRESGQSSRSSGAAESASRRV